MMKKCGEMEFWAWRVNKNADKFTHLVGFRNLNDYMSKFQAFFRVK